MTARRPVALLALALVAVLAAACGGSGSASSSPGATAAPTAMPAGTYTTTGFKPAVTYTVGDGWYVARDVDGYVALQPTSTDAGGLFLFHGASAASQDASCPASPEPSVGATSVELVTWIRSLKGLQVSSPAMATVGGLPATSLDISVSPTWTQSCPFASGLPSVPLIMSSVIDHWVVVGNERLRLFLVDVPNQGTVLVDIDAFDGALFDTLVGQATPVIKSLTFAK